MPEKPDVSSTGYQQGAYPAARGMVRERDSLDLLGACHDELCTNSTLPAFRDVCTGHSLNMSAGCQEVHWTKNEGSDNSQMHTIKCTSVLLTEMSKL